MTLNEVDQTGASESNIKGNGAYKADANQDGAMNSQVNVITLNE